MSIPRLRRIPITDGLVGSDERTRVRCQRELDNQLDEIYSLLQTIVGAGGEVAAKDGPYVLHGSTLPEGLPGAELHRNLTADDLHWPKDHADRHAILGGTGVDPFTTSHLIDAMVRRVYQLSGTVSGYLTAQVIDDGELLLRSGQDIVGGTAGSLSGFADSETPTPAGGLDYDLANAPSPAGSLILAVNGAMQVQAASGGTKMGYYSLSGNTITFEKLPSTVSWMKAWYRY